MKYIDKLLELVKESVLSQALLILFVFGTTSYLLATQQDVPDVLYGFGGSIIGFYFRYKINKEQERIARL